MPLKQDPQEDSLRQIRAHRIGMRCPEMSRLEAEKEKAVRLCPAHRVDPMVGR